MTAALPRVRSSALALSIGLTVTACNCSGDVIARGDAASDATVDSGVLDDAAALEPFCQQDAAIGGCLPARDPGGLCLLHSGGRLYQCPADQTMPDGCRMAGEFGYWCCC